MNKDASFYESELEETLLDQSQKQYGIKDNATLLQYLFRRYFIVEIKTTKMPRIQNENKSSIFMKFWLEDLGIPLIDNSFIYKGITISAMARFGSPIQNIYEDLTYQLSNDNLLSSRETNGKSEWELARLDVSEWLKKAKRKRAKYSKKHIYPYLLKSTLLERLNETFQANVSQPKCIDGVQYENPILKLTDEEICSRHLLAFHEKVKDGELLMESELEKYIVKHLNDIEEGLHPLKTQYILPNGRIDILARDKDGVYTIIELKVEKDTDVVWQKWYYTNEIKKKYNTSFVRFIVILPKFYHEIIEPLVSDNSPTEILQFHPTIHRGKLQNVTFTSYQNSKMNKILS